MAPEAPMIIARVILLVLSVFGVPLAQDPGG
jgi:hypothetical protein